MKSVLFFLAMMLCGLHAFSQIDYNAELAIKLAGKTNFQEVKSTVINHYRAKLALLSSTDSAERKGIMRQLKMWNRQFWINENYTNEQGNVEPATKVVTRALDKRNQQAATATNLSQAQSENWVSEGPISSTFSLFQGEGVGRIDRIAFHPTQPNVLFAGSPYGGLFKTTNSGQEWFPISQYVASLGVSGIVIHPTNPDIIYVLSGDGDSNGGSFAGGYDVKVGELRSACNGVYKTTNGGSTWSKLTNFPDVTDDTIYRGRNLAMDPNNTNLLLAATSRGLYRTSNGGTTWTKVTSNQNIWDVKFKPNNSNTVYCVGNNTFQRSLNNGVRFDTIPMTILDTATRISLAVTPANPNRVMLFAGNSNSNSCIAVLTSPDSGTTFTRYGGSQNAQDNLFHNYIGVNVLLNQCNYDNAIAIHPTNENIVRVGGLCVWASTDGGHTWEQETAYHAPDDILHEYIHPDIHCLAWNPISGVLYCGNDGAVYKNEIPGFGWDFIETGLSTTQFYHFEVENQSGNTWGGTQDNGILERLNYGEFGVFHGGDGYDLMTDQPWRTANGTGIHFYYTYNQFIKGGASDISVPGNTNFFGNLDMSPTSWENIYVGYQTAVYRSINAGSDWLSMGNIPGNWCIAVCHSNNQRLYAAGNNTANPPTGGIRRNDDVTTTNWNPNLNIDLVLKGYNTSLKITDIEVDNVNADSLIISVAGTKADSKVFSSANGGITWNNLSFNLPNVPVFCVKKDELGGLYIGTPIGVYYKNRDSSFWVPFYNGLPPVPVTQIEFYAANSRLQVCTFGRGIWSTAKVTNCTNNLTLTGQAVGRNYYEVSNNINSNQTILNSPGTNIIYSADNKIIFTPGARIQKGAKFRGKAQPCGGQVGF